MKNLGEKSIEMRDNNIGRLFQKAARDYSERALHLLHERGYTDITLYHTALLANLDLRGTHITTIAEKAGMTKQAMGQLANDLAEKGYVNKSKDPKDKRAIVIKFTPSGKKALHAAYDIKIQIEKDYKQLLGVENEAQLRRLLKRLIDKTPNIS